MTGSAATSFRELENVRRLAAASNDPAQHAFLHQLNELLEEDPLAVSHAAPPTMPTIFVTGLPRGGTTLATQIIAAGLDVGFVDCIAARFWLAPVYGLRLSRQIARGRRHFTFESDSGTPASPLEPHEFSYFWQHWMKSDRADPETGAPVRGLRINWNQFVHTLGAMQRELGRPMVFKALAALGRLPALAARVPQSMFVHVERDAVDVAASLLETRRRYYGDESQWWSLHPKRYRELIDRPPIEQVAGQVALLREQYEEEFGLIDDVPMIRISYVELCRNPQGLLDSIRREAEAAFGLEIGLSDLDIPTFEPRRATEALRRRSEIAKALRMFGVECTAPSEPVVHHTRVRANDETIRRVSTLMRRGRLATGEPVERLEHALSRVLDDRPVACVSSGMAALQMMLHLLGRDRKVTMPSFACEAIALAAEWTHHSIALLDSDLETMSLAAGTSAPDILVAVHQFGQPAPIASMQAKCVIEDAAHAIGARWNDRICGRLAEYAFTSFYATKLISGGYGGAVIASDERFIDEIRDLRQYNYRTSYRRRFQYPMSDIAATIALSHLEQLDEILARRREIAARYDEAIRELPVQRQRLIDGAVGAWCRYVVRVRNAEEVCASCCARGVEVRRAMPYALHDRLGIDAAAFPATQRLCHESISLPIDPHLTSAEQQHVIDALQQSVQ